jgi:adenylosuccinate lyase
VKNQYENPLITRYAGKEMSYVFSPEFKFRCWRKLWIALAESQKELGLAITDEQIKQLREFRDDINYDVAQAREKEVRHDVMSHIYAYGQQCPEAMPIIHLGATSCYVGDNTDLVQMREAMVIIKSLLVNVIRRLSQFAKKYRDLPVLGFTHYQPAQLTTVGKRACLWLQDLVLDYHEIEHRLQTLKFRGVKGTTGTQASYLKLFNGDHSKVEELDRKVAGKMGFGNIFIATGQTYPRKLDSQILDVLSGIAQSAHRFSSDIRLLSNLQEIEEPFGKSQIGSSAMAYKRNPMRSERIASLSRFIISMAQNPAYTAATQWMERTLDDSANKRLSIPQSFLAADAVLNIYLNVASGLVVQEKMIARHIDEQLPFMATENILMEAVQKGGDRQKLHEKIRTHSLDESAKLKDGADKNRLLERIANDKSFGLSAKEIEQIVEPRKFIGRAPEQVDRFIEESIKPVLDQAAGVKAVTGKVEV